MKREYRALTDKEREDLIRAGRRCGKTKMAIHRLYGIDLDDFVEEELNAILAQARTDPPPQDSGQSAKMTPS